MVFEKLSKGLRKLPFSVLEPTFHIFAGYYLNKKLERLEDEGSISEFESRIARTQKHHYKMELKLSLTNEQAKELLSNLIGELPIGKRR